MDKDEILKFSVDTPALLKEICDCSLDKNNGLIGSCLNIFRQILAELAERAIELNDPKLNILMIRLNLYEVENKDRLKVIEKLQKAAELI